MADTRKYDEELRGLWATRSTLDDPGWERLVTIVHEVLRSTSAPELASLSGDRRDWIQDFIVEKVFRPDLTSRIDHAGALGVAFRRFLLDQIRANAAEAKWMVRVNADDEDADPEALDRVAARHSADHHVSMEADEVALLAERGLALEDVQASAADWLKRQEDWVGLILAFHFCPDAEFAEPMDHLAKRTNMASNNHKISKLGVNWNHRKGLERGNSFGETMVGRWVVEDLGVEISGENVAVILLIFKILCFEALNRRDLLEQHP